MTRQEVIKKVNDAVDAIKAYKAQGLDKPRTNYPLSDGMEIIEVEKSIRGMLSESYVVGAAGTPCPTCHGSGRAPN